MKARAWMLAILVPFLVSCGTSVVHTVEPVVRSADVGRSRKVVILPFSDYTVSDSPHGYWRRNVLVNEALQDELLRFGFLPAIQEDVIHFLLERGVIREGASETTITPAMRVIKMELAKNWSRAAQSELLDAYRRNAAGLQSGEYWNPERLISLDGPTLQDLAAAFNANYIVRGRIIVMKIGQDDSFNPLQTGILPFVFKVGTRTVFGIAKSDTYEMIDKMALGGIVGAAIAHDNWPLEDDDKVLKGGHPRFGGHLVNEDDYVNWNTAIWGLGGMAVAHLAHEGGRVDEAVVQIRMIVQDAATGRVLWANRSEVKVTPRSAYGDHDEDVLIADAIRSAVGSLVDNFVATLSQKRVVRLGTGKDDKRITPAGGLQKPLPPSWKPAIVVDQRIGTPAD